MLYGRTPQAFLVTAAGASFDYASYCLSAPAQSAVDRMLAEARRLLGTPRPSSSTP